MKTFLVLPAYNESAKVVDGVLKNISHNFPLSRTIVVDDGSKVPLDLKHKAILLRHTVNLGKGAALKTGIRYAFRQGAQAVIIMDSDGQHDPIEISQFTKFLNEGYDLVFGSRRPSIDAPLIRLLGNKFASVYINLMFGAYVSDILSGYRAFNRKAYRLIKWKSARYGVETEMVARLGRCKKNLKFLEFPVETIYFDKYKGVTILDAVNIFLHTLWWKLF